MTDSFNNNVTALSVETPVTFLNACLFVLAILSTISLSDAEPGEKPGGPPLLIFRPKWGPKGRKNFFGRPFPPLLISGSGWPPPSLISGSGWPPPSYLRVWMTAPPLSQGLDDRPPSLISGSGWPPPLISGSGWPAPLPYLKVWIRHWLKRNTLLKRWKVISIRYFT